MRVRLFVLTAGLLLGACGGGGSDQPDSTAQDQPDSTIQLDESPDEMTIDERLAVFSGLHRELCPDDPEPGFEVDMGDRTASSATATITCQDGSTHDVVLDWG